MEVYSGRSDSLAGDEHFCICGTRDSPRERIWLYLLRGRSCDHCRRPVRTWRFVNVAAPSLYQQEGLVYSDDSSICRRLGVYRRHHWRDPDDPPRCLVRIGRKNHV